MTPEPTSYFTRLADDRFQPTAATEGAWSAREQHVAPTFGLLTHVIECFVAARGADELDVTRLTFEILGPIDFTEMQVTVEVVRPGRTIELLEAVVQSGGRPVVRARAWRLGRFDTRALAGDHEARLPGPDDVAAWDMTSVWSGRFIESIRVRAIAQPQPGRGSAWVTTDLPLVAGEPVSELARFVGLVDTANGMAVRVAPDIAMFPNLDLTIHFHRQPRGPWVGLDTAVAFGPAGHGVTSTVLHDEHGPVGRAEQSLTVRPIA